MRDRHPWFVGKHAVENGQLVYTSVSQIEKFAGKYEGETATGCPRKWWFNYPGKEKDPSTAAQDDGTTFHFQLEHFMRTGENVLGKLAGKIRHFLPARGNDLCIERDFENTFKLTDTVLEGYIDLIVPNRGEYVDGQGETREQDPGIVEIIDYKSAACAGYALTAAQLKVSVQLNVYAAFILSLGLDTKQFRFSHIVAPKNADEGLKRTVLVDLTTVKHNVSIIEGHIERMKIAAQQTEWSAVHGNKGACRAYNRRCSFYGRCENDALEVLTVGLLGGKKNEPEGILSVAGAAERRGAAQAVEAGVAAVAPDTRLRPRLPIQDESTPEPRSAPPGVPLNSQAGWVSIPCAVCGRDLGKCPPGSRIDPSLCPDVARHAEVPARVLPPDAPKSDPAGHSKPDPVGTPAVSVPKKARAQKAAPTEPKPAPESSASEVRAPVPVTSGGAPQRHALLAFRLYVNCLPNAPVQNFAAWVRSTVLEPMELKFRLIDIRLADNESALAFGKWKGALAYAIKTALPLASGDFYYSVDDELSRVVVESLAAILPEGALVRGTR